MSDKKSQHKKQLENYRIYLENSRANVHARSKKADLQPVTDVNNNRKVDKRGTHIFRSRDPKFHREKSDLADISKYLNTIKLKFGGASVNTF